MIDADRIKRAILDLAKENKSGNTVTLSEVARYLDLTNWSELMESVTLVADVLERQGMISVEGDRITLLTGKKQP